MSDVNEETLFTFGHTVRALENGIIEGRLVPFTRPTEKDYYNTYFDDKTDYGLSHWQLRGAPVLYHHGQDAKVGMNAIGRVLDYRLVVDDPDDEELGIWVKSQLDMRDKYEKQIYSLAKRGMLKWSSGAHPGSVVIDKKTGHVERWYIIEASTTLTPGTPEERVEIKATRSLIADTLPSFEEPMAKEGDGTNVSEREFEVEIDNQVAGIEPAKESVMSRDEIKAILAELLAEMGLTPAAVDMAEVESTMSADVEKLMIDEKLTDEARSIVITNAARAIQAQSDKRKSMVKNASLEAARAAVQPTDGVSKTAAAGVRNEAQRTGVSVGEDGRYAYQSTGELALAALIKQAHLRQAGLEPSDIPNGGMPEGLIRTLAHRVNGEMVGKGGKQLSEDSIRALRGIMPAATRANELDASTITGQGLEWISVAYGNDVWEAAREIRIYEQLRSKGMQVKEVPMGSKTAIFYTEAADPIAYNAGEATSVDATGRPAVTAAINSFGTAQVTATLAYTKIASAFTVRLQDSSPVDIASQLNYQMMEKAQETIEQLLMNGDTATAASTNINLIDGTPATGLLAPYYLGLNGFRKFALVTNTSRGYDAGGLINKDTFKTILGKLPSKLRARKDKLVYVLSAGAEQAALSIPELLTRDVAGEGWALLESGVFRRIWGVDALTTGFIIPSDSAGKNPATAPSTGYGTVALLYAPYWGFGFQRAFNIEIQRDILSDTNVYVGGFSMSLVSRSTDALALAYNTKSEGV